MITKKIYPVIANAKREFNPQELDLETQAIIENMIIEYRVFGILVYKKILETPAKHGFYAYANFYASF
jgi:hypothetical protein